MQVVNIKELKSRLSAYLREVSRGETFLVTDRSRVVAQLGPVGPGAAEAEPSGLRQRLLALGARAPLRSKRPNDYLRPGTGAGLSTEQIDALLEQARGERA